jgi:hypothetical protein
LTREIVDLAQASNSRQRDHLLMDNQKAIPALRHDLSADGSSTSGRSNVNGGVRRRRFSTNILVGLLAPLLSSATELSPKLKYVIDGANLKTVDDLVAAMRKAAGNNIPSSVQAKEFYKSIAEAFVQNIHAIADAGIKVPREMLEKLKKQKIILPIMVVVVVWGVTFLVPLAVIGNLVLGSLVVMGLFVWAAIAAVRSDSPKAAV